MSRFLAWNALLLSEFFSPTAAQEEVWLHTTRYELDSFGIHLGGAAGLVDAVATGAPWLPPRLDTCARAASLLVEQRRSRLAASQYVDPGVTSATYAGVKAPTYLPILALWVLASSDVHGKGFYATVESLLGPAATFPNTGNVTADMLLAWQDLETWSTKECGGRFGVFRRRVLGSHCHVGVPRSQCLIGRADERNIGRLFAELHLRPGEQVTQRLLARLLDDGQHSDFLSSPLRAAMADKDYADPLHTQLQRLLDSWDGLKPRNVHAGGAMKSSTEAEPASLGEADLVTLVLAQSDEIENGWDVRWRIQAPTDNHSCCMRLLGQPIPARLHPVEATFVSVNAESHRKACTDALALANSEAVEVVVIFDDANSGSTETVRRTFYIPSSTRRILCWNTLDPQFGEYLVERDIPLYGPFYILCSSGVEASTRRWLQTERVAFQDVPSNGLPARSWLACIAQAERLTAAQRQYIADAADPANVSAARIRLIGGRPLLRGGARVFAAYDLPSIDIEAPDDAYVEARGLTLEEVLPAGGHQTKSSNKRFVIRQSEEFRSAFEIKVRSGNVVLAEARLRIAYSEGEGRGQTRTFSMDSLGQSLIDDEGLRGTVIGTHVEASAWGTAAEVEAVYFDSDIDYQIEELGVTKFLDSLARLGTIAYGPARDLLRRLCDDVDPMPLLMDLRARGCLEIQTDPKGHVVRVHSVVPTLYELPFMFSGFAVAGVAGTFALPQWARLRTNPELITSATDQGRRLLPAVRVAAESLDKIRESCEAMNLRFRLAPPKSVASWSGSIEDARRTFVRAGWEHFSAKLSHLHRMKSDSAQVLPTKSEQMAIDREIGVQLFRFDDPQASPLQLYVLGMREQSGASRYSHIHDSRWGAWISVLAFARLMHDKYGMHDALPWPIQYDPITRELWIPARLRPPAILERALCLCSGSGADVHFLTTSEAVNDRLPLMDASRRAVGYVSRVYAGFFPAYWLRFRDVPAELASVVASRLGGKLDSIAATAGNDFQLITTT
jgi:hypothetical protein